MIAQKLHKMNNGIYNQSAYVLPGVFWTFRQLHLCKNTTFENSKRTETLLSICLLLTLFRVDSVLCSGCAFQEYIQNTEIGFFFYYLSNYNFLELVITQQYKYKKIVIRLTGEPLLNILYSKGCIFDMERRYYYTGHPILLHQTLAVFLYHCVKSICTHAYVYRHCFPLGNCIHATLQNFTLFGNYIWCVYLLPNSLALVIQTEKHLLFIKVIRNSLGYLKVVLKNQPNYRFWCSTLQIS